MPASVMIKAESSHLAADPLNRARHRFAWLPWKANRLAEKIRIRHPIPTLW
jgi:hypothetical protein